jgi:hypothetical protein
MATFAFKPKGAPPFAFALKFDPHRIHNRGRYALRACILSSGRLLFTSTEPVPAFDSGNKPVEIVVSRVGDTRAGQDHRALTPDVRFVIDGGTMWYFGPAGEPLLRFNSVILVQ